MWAVRVAAVMATVLMAARVGARYHYQLGSRLVWPFSIIPGLRAEPANNLGFLQLLAFSALT